MYNAFVDKETNTRLGWINLFLKINNAGVVCRRCGISRPTLRKWLRRYENGGIEGLKSQSKRPIRSPGRKVFEQQEQWILSLHRTRHLGAPTHSVRVEAFTQLLALSGGDS
jgi:transposase